MFPKICSASHGSSESWKIDTSCISLVVAFPYQSSVKKLNITQGNQMRWYTIGIIDVPQPWIPHWVHPSAAPCGTYFMVYVGPISWCMWDLFQGVCGTYSIHSLWPQNPNVLKYMSYCCTKNNYLMRLQFCTCHDNNVVVACANR